MRPFVVEMSIIWSAEAFQTDHTHLAIYHLLVELILDSCFEIVCLYLWEECKKNERQWWKVCGNPVAAKTKSQCYPNILFRQPIVMPIRMFDEITLSLEWQIANRAADELLRVILNTMQMHRAQTVENLAANRALVTCTTHCSCTTSIASTATHSQH